FHVEPPHLKTTALYKYPTNRYKNNLKRSTDPSPFLNFLSRQFITNDLAISLFVLEIFSWLFLFVKSCDYRGHFVFFGDWLRKRTKVLSMD
ncbi:hypothetical protein FCV84_02130, partial [Vibrio breoganii]